MLHVILTINPLSVPELLSHDRVIHELVCSTNPLLYSYRIPLYTAQLVSSPGSERVQWGRRLTGVFILMQVQLWSVNFDIMKIAALQMPAAFSVEMALEPWQLELVALGYQAGYLILPSVMPILIWVVGYQRYLS